MKINLLNTKKQINIIFKILCLKNQKAKFIILQRKL